MDDNKKINYVAAKIRGREWEKKFFKLLEQRKAAIYDWGAAEIIVYEDGDKKYVCSMEDERFAELSGTNFITSADMVLVLMKNGIEVTLRNANSTFKTDQEIKIFLGEMKNLIRPEASA